MDSIKDIIFDMINRSMENIKVNEKDYEVDGLLYCGDCNTPKQMRIHVLNSDRIVGISCKCQQKKEQAKKEAEARYQRHKQIERNKRESGLTVGQMQNTFAAAVCNLNNQKQIKYCRNYATKFDDLFERGQGLLLYGPPGTGKSYLTDCIANHLLDSGKRVKVLSTISIVGRSAIYKGDEYDEYVDEIVEPDLLIVDDLGAERNTDFALERVHDMIDYRTGSGKPIIVTTNYSLKQMKEETDIRKVRTFDRIFSCCFPIAFVGNSFRKQRANNSFFTIKKLLEE